MIEERNSKTHVGLKQTVNKQPSN